MSLLLVMRRTVTFEEHIYGGHVMAHWTQKVADDEQYDVQVSIDQMNRDESLFEVTVLNVDVDLQHSFSDNGSPAAYLGCELSVQ